MALFSFEKSTGRKGLKKEGKALLSWQGQQRREDQFVLSSSKIIVDKTIYLCYNNYIIKKEN